MSDSYYEDKELLPLDDLRILNSKFGWKKSMTEMYQQNLLDFYLFKDAYMVLRKIVIDSEAQKVGEFKEVSESVEKYWMEFFSLLYRVHFRNNLVRIGERKRGIPNSEVKEFIEAFETRIGMEVEKLPVYCSIHFLWFDSDIFTEDNSLEKREFMIWYVYSECIERAKQAARSLDIPVDKYFDKYEIELKLKASLLSVLNN